jgi:hypothetical protein
MLYLSEVPEPSPSQILEIAQSLGPMLSEAGVSQEELEMLGQMLSNNVDKIKSLEDFMGGLMHGLTMIAYGYPEFMDPSPATSLMMMLMEFRQELAQKFEQLTPDNAGEIVDEIVQHLVNMMGEPPAGIIEGLKEGLEESQSLDELWERLGDNYNRIAEREMNI